MKLENDGQPALRDQFIDAEIAALVADQHVVALACTS